jgi:hypothetical protein
VNSEENAFSEEVNTSDENATKKDDNFKFAYVLVDDLI